MNRLLTEMLELSRMQSGQAELRNEVLDTAEQVKLFFEKYDGYIQNKGLDVKEDAPEKLTGRFDPLC